MAIPSRVLTLVALLAAPFAAGTAQSTLTADALAQRIAGVRDGEVRFETTAREGVCGNGRSWIRVGTDHYYGSWKDRERDVDVDCEAGPVRLVIARENGRTTDVRTYVGGRWRERATAETIGAVAPAVATEYLVRLVERRDGTASDERAQREALMPATLIDAEVPWMRVLAVAKDASRDRKVRSQALFWSAGAAGDRAADEIGAIARNDPDQEVRTQAVFALSRRDDGVPRLIDIARTSRDRAVKKAAYFWLGQSDDPRAVALFEDVLSRP